MPSSSSTNFAGEKFLTQQIPDYYIQWRWITLELVMVTIFVIVVVPRIMVTIFASNDAKEDIASPPTNSPTSKTMSTTTTTGKGTSKRKSKRSRNESKSNTLTKNDNNPIPDDTPPNNDNTHTITIPSFVMPTINGLWILSCVIIVANSPNNKYAARAVFQAPLLHPAECSHVISMAEEAARRNVERATKTTKNDDDDTTNNQTQMLLMEPSGWQKTRHKSYPTTDLNLVTDPFTKEDRDYLRRVLDSRLAPLIERVYGITPAALRANDMFIVRYDPHKGQSALRRHTDSSHVSFNTLLSPPLSGGGTRFHDRITSRHIDAHPPPGDVLLNNAMVEHEGLATMEGTRYILVGFLNVQRRDAFTGVTTGVSLFASWLCLPWLDVTLNEGLEVRVQKLRDGAAANGDADGDADGDGGGSLLNNRYFRSLVRDVRVAARMIGDLWSPHSFVNLVDEENKSDYLEALDKAAAVVAMQQDDEGERKTMGATWFEGQQVSVGLDGMVAAKWESRVNAGEDSFKDDL